MLKMKRLNVIAVIFLILPVFLYIYANQGQAHSHVAGNTHFYYVVGSSVIAFGVGLAAYAEYKKNKVVKLFYIALGFIGLSIFYLFHALVTPTIPISSYMNFQSMSQNLSVFVYFGDMSRLWLALFMFLPDDLFLYNEKVKKHFNSYLIICMVVLLAGMNYLGLMRPEMIPIFKHEDMTDTYLAIFTKVITLLFLGINALRYFYSYKARPNLTTLSFIVGLLLIMETTIVFMMSKPWSQSWWLAHNLFLISYFIIGAGVLYSYFGKHKYEYFDVVGQIYAYTKLLEEKNTALYDIAIKDDLTGLSNRKHFVSTLEQAIRHAEHHQQVFALLYMDLDNFKSINDHYGHKAGDQLLVLISNEIKMCINDTDLAARIGGDEFVLLVNDADIQSIEALSKRILHDIHKVVKGHGYQANVGASIGIALYPKHGKSIDELMSKSDQAMYQVKHHMKNSYKIYS